MITENLQTLKIIRLTQEQYDRESAAGNLDENALYLTPDEATDLSGYATKDELNGKADAEHNHDDAYYTKTEIDTALENKAGSTHSHEISDITNLQTALDDKVSSNDWDSLVDTVDGKANTDHTHDDRYYTETEIDTMLEGKADVNHNHDSSYDTKGSANEALTQAKSYADSVAAKAANDIKSDLLNGAEAAYDTLKELGDLINENVDAIDALETVASGKADADHTHDDRYYTKTEIDGKVSTINTSITSSLNEAKSYSDNNLNASKTYADNAVSQKTQVQIITWGADD